MGRQCEVNLLNISDGPDKEVQQSIRRTKYKLRRHVNGCFHSIHFKFKMAETPPKLGTKQ